MKRILKRSTNRTWSVERKRLLELIEVLQAVGPEIPRPRIRLELTGRACLAFLGLQVDLLGETGEITQLMCQDLSVQEPLVL